MCVYIHENGFCVCLSLCLFVCVSVCLCVCVSVKMAVSARSAKWDCKPLSLLPLPFKSKLDQILLRQFGCNECQYYLVIDIHIHWG